MRTRVMKALYIHIPFCDHVCTYCDFYKMIAKDEVKIKYIKYLIKELKLKERYLKDIKTIYIGGGTPTALPINLLDEFLGQLSKYINLDNVVEFTIEANPNDVTVELTNILKRRRINRISLGVQTFNQKKINFLGRNHSKQKAIEAIQILNNVGFNNISVDLIYGAPNDKVESVENDLKIAVDLGVKHISAYSLILEEKTILYHLYKKGEFKPMDGDTEFEIFQNLVTFLRENNYNHYEISNYSLPGYESIHNLIYWQNQNYLGIGASASYYIDNIRYTNIKNLDKYYEGIDKGELNYYEKIQLTKLEQMQDEMIMGLRMTKGVNIKTFKEKFYANIIDVFPSINKLIKYDLLKIKDD